MRRLWLLVFIAGCASSGHELAVEVLSDLQPGAEVDRIELRLDDVSVFDGLPSRPLSEGARVADLEVSAGDHVVAGRAFFNGEMIAERRVLVQVSEDQGLTVALTRNCRDVRCADAVATCSNAMCVDPQCSPETPQFCEATAQCERNTDCAPAGVCGNVECVRGSCLNIDDGRCGSGFFCAGDEGCVVPPFVIDAGVMDVGVVDAGPDVPSLPDTGPDVPRTCPEPWGALPVGSAAVVGDGRGGESTTTLSVTPADALLAPTLTIEMWVRFIEPLSTMFLMGSETRENGGFSVRPSVTPTGDARIMYTVAGSGFLFPAPGLTDGCWHHIALVRDLPAGEHFLRPGWQPRVSHPDAPSDAALGWRSRTLRRSEHLWGHAARPRRHPPPSLLEYGSQRQRTGRASHRAGPFFRPKTHRRDSHADKHPRRRGRPIGFAWPP